MRNSHGYKTEKPLVITEFDQAVQNFQLRVFQNKKDFHRLFRASFILLNPIC